MLVLSRKSRESVVVGGPGAIEPSLKVTVLEIKNDRVRLGFEADAGIPVHRWEVWERICVEGQSDGVGEECGAHGGVMPPVRPRDWERCECIDIFIKSSCRQWNRSGKAIPGR